MSSTRPSFWTEKTLQIYAWLKLIAGTLQPFSFCEKQVLREYVTVEEISIQTYMKYMSLHTEMVQEKL